MLLVVLPDDESDRDEEDEQPRFVLEVGAGPERGSLCLDDAADDCDANRYATPMSPTSFLPAQSSTPSKLDDNAETARQWAAFSAHFLRGDLLGSSEWHHNGMILQVPGRAHSVAGIAPPRPWRSSNSSSRPTCPITSSCSSGKRVNLRIWSNPKASSRFVAPLTPPR